MIETEEFGKIIVVGDRVLIKPKTAQSKTKSGLYLPPGVHEKEVVHSGYVMKVGPGYPFPRIGDAEEPWKEVAEPVKYIPLQPKEGDLAVYLQKSTYEIEFNGEKYIIAPHSSILILVRDEKIFE